MNKILVSLLCLSLSLSAQEKPKESNEKSKNTKEKAVEKKINDTEIETGNTEVNDPFANDQSVENAEDEEKQQEENRKNVDKIPRITKLAYGFNEDGESLAIIQINDKKDQAEWLYLYEGDTLSLSPLPYSIYIESISKNGVHYTLLRTEAFE